MTSGRWLWVLIAASALLRLACAAGLGPINDEAYHYLFAVHPDWSYFDHPPMLAVVERLGLAVVGGRASPLALRLGFIALFAGSTWLMARLAGRFYGPRAGLLAAVVLNATAYYGIAAGTFALPDGPLLFFWLLTLNALAAAVAAPGGLKLWVGVGLAWGGALLSKYHAVFLPAGALLYLAAEPSARRWLRHPGPYLAVLVGAIAFAPVIAWNVAHGWASFAFQGGRALGKLAFRPDTLAAAVLWPAAYLFPWLWLFLVAALARRCVGLVRGGGTPADRFLICQAVLPLSAFLAVACVRPVLPHWSLVGFLPAMPLLGRAWADRFPEGSPRLRRRVAVLAAVPAIAGLLGVAHVRAGLFQEVGYRLAGRVALDGDLTADQCTWRQVGAELRRRGLVGEPGTFLFTGQWYHSGQLAMAVGGDVPVLCYNAGDARGFAFWSRPAEWVGRDGILVCLGDRSTEPGFFDRWFRRIEPIGEFAAVRAGRPVRKVRLFRCVGQTWPFPYDYALAPARVAEAMRAHPTR